MAVDKLYLMTYKCLHRLVPTHLSSVPLASDPGHFNYILPSPTNSTPWTLTSTLGPRSFSVSWPASWNTPPPRLQDTDLTFESSVSCSRLFCFQLIDLLQCHACHCDSFLLNAAFEIPVTIIININIFAVFYLRFSRQRCVLSWKAERYTKANQQHKAKQEKQNNCWVWSSDACVQSWLRIQHSARQLVLVAGSFTALSFHAGLWSMRHRNSTTDRSTARAEEYHTSTKLIVACI